MHDLRCVDRAGCGRLGRPSGRPDSEGTADLPPAELRGNAGGLVSASARQRLRGLLVIGVVAVAALVLAQLLHPPVPGSASRGPIPRPPAVGDCLADPTISGQQQLPRTTPTYPWLRTGPCQGRRFGEVAAVLTEHDLPPTPTSSDPIDTARPLGGDPYNDLCWTAATVWLGLPTPNGFPVPDRWMPDLQAVDVALSGPNQVQRASGQNWVACIALGKRWTAATDAASYDAIGYDTTARNTFTTGPPLPVFAYCQPTAENSAPLSCSTPHAAERFGSTFSDRSSTEQHRRDCLALAQRLTGMPDPTAGGRLTSLVVDSADDGNGGHFLECVMVAVSPHQLTGPLLGLTDRPVPIT